MPDDPNNWKSLVDELPDPIARVDRDYRQLYVNWQWLAETGLTWDACRGKTFREIGFPAESCEILESACRRAIAEKSSCGFERPLFGPDGQQQYTVRVVPEFDSSGEAAAALILIRNVTPRVKVEAALAESESRFRAFMDHRPGNAWIKDEDGRYVYLNKGYEQRFGVNLSDWRGKKDADLWPQEIARKFRENDLAVLSDGQTREVVEETRNPDGSLTYWWNFKFLICDALGRKYVGGCGIDVTDRKLAEQGLQDSELRLRALMETAAFVVVGMTPDYKVFEWNRAAERIYGYTREEVLGKDYLVHFLPEEARAGVAEEIGILLAGRPTEAYPNDVLHRDGSRRTLLWNACRLLDNHGEIRGLIAIGQDITPRIRAEAALREHEERLELALDASHAGTWSWDVVRNASNWDRRYSQLYELEPDRLPSFENWIERVDPQDRERLTSRIQAMIEPGGADVWNEEFRTIPLSRGVRWMAGIGRVERDTAGRAVRFSGLNLDITDRKQAEVAARQSADDVRALMEAFPDLYFWIDADGTIRRYHAGAPTYVPPEQFLNRRMQDVIPPEVGRRLMSCVNKALETRTIQEAEYSLPEQDGVRWYDARYVPLHDSQTLLVVIRDVTARREAEEEGRKLQAQLQHSQKLESLGVLAGGIAHDFNNILTAMMGYTDLALTELPAGSSLRLHLECVMTSARRAAELTQQMLAYSGKGQFAVAAVNLNDLVQELGSLLKASISKKASVCYRFDPALPSITADPAQIRQIVMNLMINASDALQDRDGTISIATGVRHWSRDELATTYLDEKLPAGNYVTLDVSDTGAGMDAETRSKIFDPFFTTKAAGRGLGLAAVLGIIRGHHGAIQVSSVRGQGSTFRVLLPISETASESSSAGGEDQPQQRQHGTVLIVDDEVSVRELAQAMLERAGFSVLTAPDGQAALRVYQQHAEQIVLVLLDLTMPLMSGEETLRELQRRSPQVRVILSSGYNEQSTVSEFTSRGSAGFLQKPYRYRDLLDAVAQALA